MHHPKRAFTRTLLGLTAVLSLTSQTFSIPAIAQEMEATSAEGTEIATTLPGGSENGLFDAAPPAPSVMGASGGWTLPAAQEEEVWEKPRVIRDADPTNERCFRIPAIATAKDGSLLIAFDDRYGGGAKRDWCRDAPYEPDRSSDPRLQTDVMLYRSQDDGASFDEGIYIKRGTTDKRGLSYTDPALVVDRNTGKIFAFFVRGYDRRVSLADAGYHEDADADLTSRKVQDTVVIESNDHGQTWENLRLISNLTDKVTVKGNQYQGYGRFVTSGSGIQLRYGEHAGRLIVPIAVDVVAGNGFSFVNLAIYSDDGGKEWKVGEGVGGRGTHSGDENKLVELSDGRIMMNSRENGKDRWISYSEDQGEHWSDPEVTVVAPPQHPSMRNTGVNVGLIRAYPNAPEGSAAAKVLLFSAPIDLKTNRDDGRHNGWVMASCDDGQTWKYGKQIDAGKFLYSVMTPLSDGTIGMVYESETPGMGGNLKFTKFNMAWLGADCLSEKATGVTPEKDPVMVAAKAQAEATAKKAEAAQLKVDELTEALQAERADAVMLRQKLAEAQMEATQARQEAEKLRDAVAVDKQEMQTVKEQANAALEQAKSAESKLADVERKLEESQAEAAELAKQAKENAAQTQAKAESIKESAEEPKESTAEPRESGASWGGLLAILGLIAPVIAALFGFARNFFG